MDQEHPPVTSRIDDLFALTLVDGLPATVDGKTIFYKRVRLRETGVAHERAALRQAERVVVVGGVPKLMVSDGDFRFAMTAQHVESFECDGVNIPSAMIDLETVGKLSTHDFGLVEQRVALITLAAEVRYGNISQAEFEAYMTGRAPQAGGAAPQPVGPAADVGADAAADQPGPAMLADFTGGVAAGAPAVDAA